ncbi:hypothetical protein CEXT_584681 [Caerostris extrusa]|uniref:Uncharacterized protein n=1 Tax=Caerostris extrusa TaxID=172846 RepID=A0AAV4P205_CAEEX|nr:hypothetical protein CEXT_584681 [Caerostris extrusa]
MVAPEFGTVYSSTPTIALSKHALETDPKLQYAVSHKSHFRIKKSFVGKARTALSSIWTSAAYGHETAEDNTVATPLASCEEWRKSEN